MRRIPHTELEVHPLCLGGNVFGWTADEEASFAVLDLYADVGGNFVDSADVYSEWVDGNSGGESEAVLGRWMASRENRDEMTIATKVGMKSDVKGLGRDTIRKAAEASLERLQTDYIDLYFAHRDDPDTPLEETLAAFDELVREGKVRSIAASNYSAPRLAEALAISDREGLARYVALQPEYNLVERDGYENGLRDLCAKEELGCVPYYSLASGFLAGKFRSRDAEAEEGSRGSGAARYLDERGERVLAALDSIAAAQDAPVAAVSLAWLAAQPTVVAPIASARTEDQLEELLELDAVELSEEDLEALATASA